MTHKILVGSPEFTEGSEKGRNAGTKHACKLRALVLVGCETVVESHAAGNGHEDIDDSVRKSFGVDREGDYAPGTGGEDGGSSLLDRVVDLEES